MREAIRVLVPRLDLGVRALVPEWARLRAREGLRSDVAHGLRVAAAMLPLSLWLAIASGVPPETGIVSAAVGSAVAVFFGGTRVAVTAPGLTSALLVSHVAAEHGMGAVGAVVVQCGILQLASGALGLGRFVRLVPVSVVRGVVVGLGALMLITHLPALIGAPLEPDSSALAVLDHFGAHVPSANVIALAIAGFSALCGLLLPRISRWIPGSLLGLVVPAALVGLLDLDVPTLEAGRLPSFAFPAFPSRALIQLGGTAVAVWLTASLGTLVSTSALERYDNHRTDPDQELIGTGLANVALGFLGCPPATQLVPASFAARRLGSVARRASLVQAVVVLSVGLAAWPVLSLVPIAGLTGVVFATAIPLLAPGPLRHLARIARFELAVAAVTAIAIALFGLLQGLESGFAVAIVAATFRLARTRAILHEGRDGEPHHVSLSGLVTFLAALELERLRDKLLALDPRAGLVIDVRSVVTIDATGAKAMIGIVRDVRDHGGRVALLGPSAACRERLLAADPRGEVAGCIAPTARDLESVFERPVAVLSRQNLLSGVSRFRDEVKEHYESLFEDLADGQHPHTLFITCADSRISPAQMMGAHPGDIFIVRCIGALVPPPGTDDMPQEGAAIEYGVGVLGIKEVVVCGHSKCGAISALKKGSVPPELPSLGAWAHHAAEVAGDLSEHADVESAARAVTVRQLEHIKAYPLVKGLMEKGELRLHAWFYDLGKVELYEWSEDAKEYVVVGSRPAGA
ncbi:MAG: bifunctional SulP family inorganic anion transporter/carbonic anhydrase [Sandaracinaceae bacterium]|nr:bifunctional SulP family inorganic anion transporter/carbonic anhydrase [Sandaracinaceae bacterium]